jgi:hypothetical protein
MKFPRRRFLPVLAASNLARRNSENAPHMRGQMALVGETRFQRNLANRRLALPQRQRRSFHPAADYILVHGHAQ